MRILCLEVRFLGWIHVFGTPRWLIRRKIKQFIRECRESRDGATPKGTAIKMYRDWKEERGFLEAGQLEEDKEYIESIIAELDLTAAEKAAL